MPMNAKGADLRKGRYSEPGRIYLLTCVVHKRRPLFTDFWAGRLLVAQFRQAEREGHVASLAWVVMPDHFHWLVELKAGSLGQVMRRVKARSSLAIVAAGRGTPRIWQKSFHDSALRREEDILPAARYIVANPKRAGLVQRAGDYPLWDAVWF